MGLYESVARPLAFRIDPERVHELAMRGIQSGLFKAPTFSDSRLESERFGVRFPNPVGLAAGFDKNGVALDRWRDLGFGFIEAGTVTFRPQSGNPKPRMFRVPEAQGLINRMGFNNEGAGALAHRLEKSNPGIPLGINLGKSKIAELAAASEDYAGSFHLLHTHGDYFVVNVSSPNTPGLRSLQDAGALREILAAMREVDPTRPVFVKVAPDLTPDALDEVVGVAVEAKLTGLIATNTTISREMLPRDPGESGGLSGRPVQEMADRALAHLYRTCPKDMVLIGVGGIMNGDDAYRKITLGAHLVQIYTGWIYGGPGLVPAINRRIVELMERDGFKTLDEVRGSAK
ncbi:quinone-dependent dihydroorotate dehydrogenase [bacterium]|nr:MAG: quinone-dependent dihydroorotate dehydrogenase [bacterium]